MDNNSVAEKILDMGLEDVIIFENPSYDTAFIGVTSRNQAVYDYNKMIEFLVENENMTEDEAADFICYNDSFCQGDKYPLILYPYDW